MEPDRTEPDSETKARIRRIVAFTRAVFPLFFFGYLLRLSYISRAQYDLDKILPVFPLVLWVVLGAVIVNSIKCPKCAKPIMMGKRLQLMDPRPFFTRDRCDHCGWYFGPGDTPPPE